MDKSLAAPIFAANSIVMGLQPMMRIHFVLDYWVNVDTKRESESGWWYGKKTSSRYDDLLVNNATTKDKIGITVLSTQDSTLFFSNDWQFVLGLAQDPGSWKTILDDLLSGSGNWIG